MERKVAGIWLNSFPYDHCHYNKIILLEQAAGKKRVWVCTEHLLINKSIILELRNKKRKKSFLHKKASDIIYFVNEIFQGDRLLLRFVIYFIDGPTIIFVA